jgi:hypothetical protein
VKDAARGPVERGKQALVIFRPAAIDAIGSPVQPGKLITDHDNCHFMPIPLQPFRELNA